MHRNETPEDNCVWDSAKEKFYETVHSINLLPDFDLTNWEEEKKILGNKKMRFSTLDIVTLCKLFAAIISADRLRDGLIISYFKNGTISKIIRALKKKISVKKKREGLLAVAPVLINETKRIEYFFVPYDKYTADLFAEERLKEKGER